MYNSSFRMKRSEMRNLKICNFTINIKLELFPSSKSGSNEIGNKYQRPQKRIN
ncbi:MAG: hypothetical protein FWH18_08210 [Marinilabiliaceae bacterium]|nr:hypothetical protein [Marinilabiliaceae bacterium]